MAMPATRLAQDQAQRLGQRRIGLVVHFGEIGAEQPVFQHLVDIAGHAGHADAAQRLDAGLLQRIIGGAGFGLGRGALAVGVGVVAREPHGHGVALAAGNGDVAQRRQARQVGEPRLVGGQHRPVGREAHFELALAADGAHRRAHRRLERRGGVGLVGLGTRGQGHVIARIGGREALLPGRWADLSVRGERAVWHDRPRITSPFGGRSGSCQGLD